MNGIRKDSRLKSHCIGVRATFEMARKWKPGEIGWINFNDLYGVRFQQPMKVQVLSVLEGDLHPLKVKGLDGRIYYCKEDEIQTRAAKAQRKPAKTAVSEDIRKEASKMAEKRMEELKNAGKPTFAEVTENSMPWQRQDSKTKSQKKWIWCWHWRKKPFLRKSRTA